MENNMNNQNLDNAVNVTNSLTMKDRIKGGIRRNITVKKVVGAAAFGASCYGIGYAVGHHKNKTVTTDPEPIYVAIEKPQEEDAPIAMENESLSEEQPETTPEEKEVEA